ncbi:NPP1 family protein [Myceligenerans pegani]|uniref:NPP1 family protein n=1 Tax=Myceligenerans pegani TaxID=2776917 RepID=UPI00299E1F33|nr:NPP1 family protein [Myceligenerans sp. TRM 65318]
MKSRTSPRAVRALVALAGAIALILSLPNVASAAVLDPLPPNHTSFQRTFQPYFDYDGDGCLPVAAIDDAGRLNGGLKDTGPVTGECRSGHLGKANTYSRATCNNGWCAIAYSLYFEKDMSCDGCTATSHRHDWEGVVVWVPEGSGTPSYVSVSRHGQYETKRWSDISEKVGPRVKAVYHKDGISTHVMRFAKQGEQAEAWGDGGWDEPALVSWSRLRSDLRDTLNRSSWGDANFPLQDGRFPVELSRAKPSGIPFDPHA